MPADTRPIGAGLLAEDWTAPLSLGAVPFGDGRTRFRVWAPNASRVDVVIKRQEPAVLAMAAADDGYFEVTAEAVVGERYLHRLDGELERPDPASRSQPEGVHGSSQIVSTEYDWTDSDWQAPSLEQYAIYELHVGTFTPEGTFDGVVARLDYLKDLGITAVELMPIAQFPGSRNWGYDGVYPYAAQDGYGGIAGFQRLVDACHAAGLAVVLDVVYNHMGPEGNYLRDFGPYFTEAYKTPWGAALNFDGAGSDEVRRFFIESALQWTRDLHVDALRLDAIHAIVDPTAYPVIEQLSDAVHAAAEARGRTVQVIAESSLNDPRIVRSKDAGGWGLDGVWNDDLHHALHTVLTGESTGYYEDFGGLDQLADSIRGGFAYTGQFSAFRRRSHGRLSDGLNPHQFVVCSQNHDQVGNRMLGDRLSTLVSFEQCKLAAACVLLSPNVPLLFMGEEYGETAPFPYFVSHSDADLIEAVRRGRQSEFSEFAWASTPPDPQDEATFRSAVLNLPATSEEPSVAMLRFYKELIGLRRELLEAGGGSAEVETAADSVITVRRDGPAGGSLVVLNFSDSSVELRLPPGEWSKRMDSSDSTWAGSGSELPEASFGGQDLTIPGHTAALFMGVEKVG